VSPLERAARRLAARLGDLEARLDDERVWPEYIATAAALAQVAAQTTPGSRSELLTTRQLAERLNLSPKTVLKRARRGEIQPALRKGKLIRWHRDAASGGR
jgi:excisionase family DNA binding protein